MADPGVRWISVKEDQKELKILVYQGMVALMDRMAVRKYDKGVIGTDYNGV